MNIKDIQFIMKQREASTPDEVSFHPGKLFLLANEIGILSETILAYKAKPTEDAKLALKYAFANCAIMLGLFANWVDTDIEEALDFYWPKFLEFEGELNAETDKTAN